MKLLHLSFPPCPSPHSESCCQEVEHVQEEDSDFKQGISLSLQGQAPKLLWFSFCEMEHRALKLVENVKEHK